MSKKSISIRSSPEFKKMINDIKMEEMKRGKVLSDRRITLAMTRVPGLKEFIVGEGIKDDKE
ncbi:hypothetical protein CMI37_21825 [Candidatus Pacearchaeota archaeon]|jgi:hypothetical protein|nr:hypothetical protein [Candidatus Pacearchaeota archaeon]|tara:strand:- start:4674 stop:4859 length:186 start_codon:yes stop_codon:yes gene_type:complete